MRSISAGWGGAEPFCKATFPVINIEWAASPAYIGVLLPVETVGEVTGAALVPTGPPEIGLGAV